MTKKVQNLLLESMSASDPPTVFEMQSFAMLFSAPEWAELCKSRQFVEDFVNLGPASVAGLAGEILRTCQIVEVR